MAGAVGLLRVPRGAEGNRVIGCQLAPQQRARLTDALRGHATLQFVETAKDLLDQLEARVERVDVVVIPAQDHDGRNTADLVKRVGLARPRVAILAYCQAGQQYSAEIRALTAAGAHEIVLAGITDTGSAFRNALDAARKGCAAESVMHELATVVPALLHSVVEAIVSAPAEVTTLRQLADRLCIHRRTLFNWCSRANFLPPAELLTWVRLVLVGYHLVNTGCTVETIALEMAYPSDTALRNALKRYTKLTATAVRERGGATAVILALEERVRNGDTLHPV